MRQADGNRQQHFPKNSAAPALVFDITTLSQRAHLRPTGIDRIQLEIAMELVEQGPSHVAFCTYNSRYQRFDRVSSLTVQELGRRMRGAASPSQDQPGSSRTRTAANSGLRFGRSITRRLARRFPKAMPHLRGAASHGVRAFVEAAKSLRCLGTDLAARWRKPAELGAACFTREWTAETTYCSVGMDWAHNDLGLVAKQKSSQGFRTALMVHDLLDSVAPQYSGVNHDNYFLAVLAVADTVIVNSDATSRDIGVFAADHHMPVPDVVKLPMGSILADLARERPGSINSEIDGRYILCVGTVTIRKNHHLLFDVWERMIAERSADDVPTLIVAGAKGWISDETMSRLVRTPTFQGVVQHIPDATDENIAWLYQHCAFTVYPSFYEGWGLPVSESHDFGKLCLTTDRSSLPEAGEGLADLLDPYDRRLWLERIVHFWNDKEARSEREHRIRHDHVRVTARDSADAILETAGLPRCT